MGLNAFSDYGSGSSMNSLTSSGSLDVDWGSFQSKPTELPRHKSSNFADLMGRCTLEDVMLDFKMNGSDSPYNPDDELWIQKPDSLSGMGPPNVYLRQKSWPAPERTPAARLPPAPRATSWARYAEAEEIRPASAHKVEDSTPTLPVDKVSHFEGLTEEQRRVLGSLPGDVVHSLLREMEKSGAQPPRNKRIPDECRFCKNNGEREAYYRSHATRDARGRVTCPVLRAFTCPRCGARGDTAHTRKYCPLTSHEERMKSAAMMHSVRMASGRRRRRYSFAPSDASNEHYVVFGETPSSIVQDNDIYNLYGETPLEPVWAALEQRLLL